MPEKKTTRSVKKVTPAKKLTKGKSVEKQQSSLHVASMKKSQTTTVSYAQYVQNPRMWVGAAAVLVVVLLFLFKGIFIAALVNGQPISRLQVINQLEKQNGKQALSNLVVEDLIMQEAQNRHIGVSQSDIEGQVKKIQDTLKTQGVTLNDALAARGLTQQDLVDQIKVQTLLNKMVGSSVKVSDADVQAYIDKNQDSLPKDLSDVQLKAQVRQQLQQQQLQDKTQTFIADLQKKAQIQYFVSY